MKTKMRFTKCAFAALGAASLLSTTAFSANATQTLADRGTIQNVDRQDRMLTITEAHSKKAQVFVWDQDTRVLERTHLFGKAKAVSPDLLKQGETVKIRYQKENDRSVAKEIVITRESQAATATTQQNA